MKLGAIPSIIFLIVMAYIAIPSESNLIFKAVDFATAGFCPDQLNICGFVPILKTIINIGGALGFLATLLSIVGQLFRGEFFRPKQQA